MCVMRPAKSQFRTCGVLGVNYLRCRCCVLGCCSVCVNLPDSSWWSVFLCLSVHPFLIYYEYPIIKSLGGPSEKLHTLHGCVGAFITPITTCCQHMIATTISGDLRGAYTDCTRTHSTHHIQTGEHLDGSSPTHIDHRLQIFPLMVSSCNWFSTAPSGAVEDLSCLIECISSSAVGLPFSNEFWEILGFLPPFCT